MNAAGRVFRPAVWPPGPEPDFNDLVMTVTAHP